jgi:cobalamin biosynthesis Mg chelatase CobN
MLRSVWNRPFVMFETDEGSAGAGTVEAGADPVDVSDSGSPEALAEGTPSPGPAAPAWTDDPSFHEAVAEQAEAVAQATLERYLAQFEQKPEAAPAGQLDLSGLDPLDENYTQNLLAAIGQMFDGALEQRLAPLYQREQQEEAEQGNKLVADLLDDVMSRSGEFLLPEQSKPLAEARLRELAPEYFQKYGATNRAAELAAQRAVKEALEYETSVGKAYHERQQNLLQALAGASPEPGVGGQGVVRAPVGGDEEDVARRYAARQF